MALEFMEGKPLLESAESAIHEAVNRVRRIARENQRRVLEAFWDEKVSMTDLQGSTGYGLDDESRDKLERVYARVFGTEAAIVRPQIISGTHALKLGLFGLLRPGDHLLFATGQPYDTLEAVVGIRDAVGSLKEWGVEYGIVPLTDTGGVDAESVLAAVGRNTKVVMFQRSRGYSDRPACTIAELEMAFTQLKERHPHVSIVVDNCYGEFTEVLEPSHVGADLVIGSLIKNPGGGIASTGGYLAGNLSHIEAVAAHMTAPGVGREAGPSHDFMRPFYQGFFLAPHVVAQALQGSILASYVFEQLGYDVSPRWDASRSDLILSIRFGNPEDLLKFCRAVQNSAPIDAYVQPYASPMAGYEDDVVMAAGAFVQGGSLELSADAPMRPPYTGYFQGGLTYEHVYIAVERIAAALLNGANFAPTM